MMVVTVLNSPEHRVDGWLLLFGILNWGILGSLLGLALGVSLSLIRAKFGRRSLSVRVSAAGL